jgi:hypothetical protein
MLREAAKNKGVDTEFLADFDRFHLLSLEGEGGGARNDMQPAEARELVDQALRDAIAQVLVRGVASCILERQHCHHADRCVSKCHLVGDDDAHRQQRDHMGGTNQATSQSARPRRCER